MAIRVHLADDHTMFRAGLEAILASHEGVEVVGASPCGQASLARGNSSTTSDCLASVESGREVMAISGTLKRRE